MAHFLFLPLYGFHHVHKLKDRKKCTMHHWFVFLRRSNYQSVTVHHILEQPCVINNGKINLNDSLSENSHSLSYWRDWRVQSAHSPTTDTPVASSRCVKGSSKGAEQTPGSLWVLPVPWEGYRCPLWHHKGLVSRTVSQKGRQAQRRRMDFCNYWKVHSLQK